MILGAVLALSTVFANSPSRKYRDIRFEALHNEHLFGGDMLLPQDYILRNGIPSEEYRWYGYPGSAEVPYVIDKSLEKHTDIILEAMDAYHDNTCIRFVPRLNEKNYVKIFKGRGCYSLVGRNKGEDQPQPLSLGDGCMNVGTIIHELGHTIGFYHEQNRSDRDKYLIIYPENVSKNQWHNFKKLRTAENVIYTPFDYNSIMIYGNYAFSKHPFEDMTMEALNGQVLLNPYDKKTMTKSDIERINMFYKCNR